MSDAAPFEFRYTTASGPGDTAAQDTPAASLGGYAARTPWAGGVSHDLFAFAPASDVADARADYRAVFALNTGTTALTAVRAYITYLTAGSSGLEVGVDPRPVAAVNAFAPTSVDVATGYTAPQGVSFYQPTDYSAGVAVGDLPPGYGRTLWVKRVPRGAGANADGADLICQAADARSGVRRVYWRTEPYAAATRPNRPPTYVPTPSPFRRMAVDYLSEGAARVTWEFDRQMTDPDPYVYQLQASQSGTPGTDDWDDAGPPVRDALYLLDPSKRLWGMSNVLHYRVVLTTPSGTYTSPPVAAEGLLDRQGWLMTQEVLRKELLMLRGLLRQDGYLLKAKRYGTPCTCVDPQSRELTNSACHVCFAGDTLVRTETGFKRIDAVDVGERVLSMDGTYQRVVRTMRRRYHGDAYLLRTSSMTRPVVVTPEHPLRGMTGTHEFTNRAREAERGGSFCAPSPCDYYMERLLGALKRPTGATFHKKSGKWRGKSQVHGVRGGGSVTLGYFATREQAQQAVFLHRQSHFDLGRQLDWVQAKALRVHNWLDTTYPAGECDVTTVDIPVTCTPGRKRVHKRRGAARFTVDEEFLWVIGMYIAEGSCGDRAIGFALHQKETGFGERIGRFFRRYGFDVSTHYPKTGLGMCVTVNSTNLAQWFPKWLGRLAENKRIPEELMRLPENKTRALLDGIWCGDGFTGENAIGQTSEVLALQLTELLHRLDEQPLNCRMTERPGHMTAWITSWRESSLLHRSRKGRWEFGGRTLSKIVEHEKVEYCGEVFNLEVEGTHTYVVQNVVVHNCFGTGLVGGYFAPVPATFANLDAVTSRERQAYNEGMGTVKPTTTRGRMAATVPVVQRDAWVAYGSDDRYYVHTVKVAADWRGVPVVNQVELRLAPRSDILYQVPVVRADDQLPDYARPVVMAL